ncbi:MAG: hypothetical protein L0Z49_10860 [Actinobacteria bacterium]|nr:hypothetical protein [Actinomycetota bacterium]MCI0544926.1 hypothetical protein [Actinomycetota bacterium]
MADYDPVAMLRVLMAHEVEFVVIGGVAARLRGAPILTQDLDVTPRRTKANLEKLSAALRQMKARLRTPTEPDGVEFPIDPSLLEAAQIWTLVTEFGDLDLVLEPDGTRGFEDLRQDADLHRVAVHPSVSVQVASLEDIIRSKQASGRAKDQAALPLLRQTLDELDLQGRG